MIWDYFKLAFGNLRHRGLRSWLTILGIFIGIAAVVALISLGNGLESAVVGQFGALDTDILTFQNSGTGFGPPGSTAIRKLTDNDVKIVESVQGVDEVISRLIRVVKMEFNKKANFNYIASLPEDQKKADLVIDTLHVNVQEGKMLKADDKGKVVLGNDFLGDSFGKKIKVGDNLIIQGESFEVIGFLEKASTFIINSAILMPEKDLRRILNIPEEETDLIVIRVASGYNPEDVAQNIERKIRKDRNEKEGEEDFSIQTAAQALSSVNTILNIVNLVITGIAAISLFVGGIGIANTMYTSVLERTKEIGTMKAIGAKNKDILYIFVIESGLLGLVGGVIGAAIGLGLAFGVSFIASGILNIDIMVVLSWPLLLGAIAFSFVVGVLSGIIPAIQASKLNIVDALRR